MTLAPRNATRHLQEIAGYLLIPALLLLFNLWQKWQQIDLVEIGVDEPFTIFHAQMHPADIVEALKIGNNPPLMELLLHYWMKLFGDSPAAVRFPSTLAASLTAVWIFGIGWRVKGMGVGIVGALLYTFATEHIYYAHEARIYAIFSMLTAASVLLVLRLRDNPRSKRDLLLLLLTQVAMIWGHYFGFIVIGLEAAWVLLLPHPRKKELVIAFAALGAATLLAYIPHVQLMMERAAIATGDHWVGPSSIKGMYNTIAKHCNQPVVAVMTLAMLALGAASGLWAWIKGGRRPTAEALLLLLFFPGGLLLLYAAGKQVPVFLERYAIFSLTLLYPLTAIAIWELPWSRFRLPSFAPWAAAAPLIVGMSFTHKLAPTMKSEWRTVAALIAQQRQPDEIVLISPSWCRLGFSYHYRPDIFRQPYAYDSLMNANGLHGIMKYTPLEAINGLPEAKRIWVISAGDPHADLHPSVQALLDTSYFNTRHHTVAHGITSTEYLRQIGE